MLPLGESIKETASVVKKCTNCGILDVIVPCKICSSENRSKTTICIVEDMADVWAFERSGYHKGLYHVIGGLLSVFIGLYTSFEINTSSGPTIVVVALILFILSLIGIKKRNYG